MSRKSKTGESIQAQTGTLTRSAVRSGNADERPGGMQKSVAARIKRLNEGYAKMREAVKILGESDEIPNGLRILAKRVEEATVLDDDAVGTVSASGSVYKGDLVTKTLELGKTGESVRIANGEATLLGSVSLGGTAALLFAQDDNTHIKTARWNGTEWTLGATKIFAEGPLDRVTMIPYQTSPLENQAGTWYLACFYWEDSVGMVQFWALTDDGLVRYGTDIWTDAPLGNLCGGWTPELYMPSAGIDRYYFTNAITLAGLNGEGKISLAEIVPSWHWSEAEQQSYLSAYLRRVKTVEPGEYPGVSFNGEKLEGFTVPAPDPEVYGSAAWNLVNDPKKGSMLLVYPAADGKRYALELWLAEKDHSQTPAATYPYEPSACRVMMLEGQLPCGAGLDGVRGGGFPLDDSPILAAGLSRLSGPGMKSSVGVEQWYSGYKQRFLPLWFGEEDQSYGKNVGLLSMAWADPGKSTAAVGYHVEGKYRAFLLYLHPKKKELVGGPGVELADADTAGALVESGGGAALAWQKSGSIYLQQFEGKETVVSTLQGSVSDGVAVTGGRGGQEIKIRQV